MSPRAQLVVGETALAAIVSNADDVDVVVNQASIPVMMSTPPKLQ